MKRWKILANFEKTLTPEKIVDILLTNRGLVSKKTRLDFLSPADPSEITASDLKISEKNLQAAITRLKSAKKKKEAVLVYADYDTDGICAAAILWDYLYKHKFSVLPHIPDRFDEGYGLNPESVERLKKENKDLSLIITVDNGIVAHEGVKKANELGIDVIITDHHEKESNLPKAYTIVHTTKIGGAGIAWFLVKELTKIFGKVKSDYSLELATIGTVADILPLTAANRSIVKFGLASLHTTQNLGLNKLFEVAEIEKQTIGTYEIGFVIAPRINAMGRLKNGMDALRLLCTTDTKRASALARLLNSTNFERISVVETVAAHAQKSVGKESKYSIVLAHESYHEGVIGLAASELVKKHYLPAIVVAKGKEISKASARSIEGFDIIAAIRELNYLIVSGGGHPMAAGFSIKNENIYEFAKKFEEIASQRLTDEILQRVLRVDLELKLTSLNALLLESIEKLAPFGQGNPEPVFVSKKVNVLDVRSVGKESKHLKLYLEQEGRTFSAIAFGMGMLALKLEPGSKIDVVYSLYENEWNGRKNIELRVRDIKQLD